MSIRILSLVKAIQDGDLQVLRDSRFSWGGEKRLELFDSIAEGIPLGSLIYVCTQFPLEYCTSVGPTVVAPPHRTISRDFVLDGHHRVVTLFAALCPLYEREPSGEEFAPDGTPWRVALDTETNTFVFQTEETRAASTRYFPLEAVLDQYELSGWMWMLSSKSQVARNRVRAFTGALMDALIPDQTIICKDADKLQKVFRRCSNMETESLKSI